MSGGAWEYTMANMIYENGVDMFSYDSGYSGYILNYRFGEVVLDTSGISYPNEKYYDKYSYSTSSLTRKRSKLGDGIKEVYKLNPYGWYSNMLSFVYSDLPWFRHGGCFESQNAGMFTSGGDDGGTYYTISSRIIITP